MVAVNLGACVKYHLYGFFVTIFPTLLQAKWLCPGMVTADTFARVTSRRKPRRQLTAGDVVDGLSGASASQRLISIPGRRGGEQS